MNPRRWSGWRRLAVMPLLFAALLMSTLVESLTAYSQGANSVSIDNTDELNGPIALTATCTTADGGCFVNTTVSQANREVMSYGGSVTLFSCDGRAQTYQCGTKPPRTTKKPFHGRPIRGLTRINRVHMHIFTKK